MAAGRPPVPSFTVEPRPDVAAELWGRRTVPRPPTVWVTDLLDLRPAYFRRVQPVTVTPERREAQWAGERLHRWAGGVLGGEGRLEVRLHREGIVGRVDLLGARATEIKSTSSSRVGPELLVHRSSYLEQLAMYCALSGRSLARLVVVGVPAGPAAPPLAVFDGRCPEPEAVWEEMRRRADRLRSARERQSSAGLPRCPWRGRGCEFERANACDCRGDEAPGEPLPAPAASEWHRNATLERAMAERWADSPPRMVGDLPFRISELLYPRQAFFERSRDGAGSDPAVRPPPSDEYTEIVDWVDSGPAGESTRRVGEGLPPPGIDCFRDDPVVIKVSRSRLDGPPERLLAGQPQYAAEVALRCSALGRTSGWLIVGRPARRPPPIPLDVLAVRFEEPLSLERYAVERRESLESALKTGDASALPPCPSWMPDRCPYDPECGCRAESAARSNR